VKNSNGRDSKEKKLYDYITGSIRFRKMREKIGKKTKLEELRRKEMTYFTKSWKDKAKLIQTGMILTKKTKKA
jgi:hypothetical protein